MLDRDATIKLWRYGILCDDRNAEVKSRRIRYGSLWFHPFVRHRGHWSLPLYGKSGGEDYFIDGGRRGRESGEISTKK